jgi:hypothetical protein
MMGIIVPETCWVSHKICSKKHLLHQVGILFPHMVKITSNSWNHALSLSSKYSVGTTESILSLSFFTLLTVLQCIILFLKWRELCFPNSYHSQSHEGLI